MSGGGSTLVLMDSDRFIGLLSLARVTKLHFVGMAPFYDRLKIGLKSIVSTLPAPLVGFQARHCRCVSYIVSGEGGRVGERLGNVLTRVADPD